jgi:peptidoglycan/LPS O-acetylase OafA/YrhL
MMAASTAAPHGATTFGPDGKPEISRPKLEHRRQIPALTGLRFFAAFFILFEHACDWIAQFQNSDVRHYFAFVGIYGMPLFFVLSGFVIHYNYRDLFMKAGLARALSEFAVARFARLYPLYFCFLLLALGADQFVQNNFHAPRAGAAILAHYLTLTQSWWYLIYDRQSIISQLFGLSWSISTEMYFYLCYAALIFGILGLFRLRRTILLGVLYVAVVAVLLWALRYNLNAVLGLAERILPDYIGSSGPGDSTFRNSFYEWLFYLSPYLRVLEFFLGCFVAQAFIERVDKPVTAAERRLSFFALGLALAFLVVAGLFFLAVFDLPLLNAYARFFALNFLCAPAIAVVVFCLARYDIPLARFMSLPLLVGLGESSYSIYLVHTWTLQIFERPAQPLTAFWASYAAFRVVLAIAFTLVVAYGTYRLIELPARAYLRGVMRRRIVRVSGSENAAPKPSSNKEQANFKVFYTLAAVLMLFAIAFGGQMFRYGFF